MAPNPPFFDMDDLDGLGLAGGAVPHDASEAAKQLAQLSRWEAWQLWQEANIGYSHKRVKHLPAIELPNGCVKADGKMITPPKGFAFARNARVRPQPQRLTRIAVMAFHDQDAIRHMLVDGWAAAHLCGDSMCINPDHIVVEPRSKTWIAIPMKQLNDQRGQVPTAQGNVRGRLMKREINFWVMCAIVAIMSISVGALLRRARQ